MRRARGPRRSRSRSPMGSVARRRQPAPLRDTMMGRARSASPVMEGRGPAFVLVAAGLGLAPRGVGSRGCACGSCVEDTVVSWGHLGGLLQPGVVGLSAVVSMSTTMGPAPCREGV